MPQKENPEFLSKKYADLPGSKPVERAVQKARREGEPIPDKKLARIQTYLDRIEKIEKSGTPINSEKGWQLLKNKLVKEFSIDTSDEDTMDKVAYALYQSEKKRAREQGRTEELQELEQLSRQEILGTRKQLVQEKQAVQHETLNHWLEYLHKNDADHPMWFRYYVARNLQKMGALDKEKGEYTKRTKETTAPFPELNAEALGTVKRWLTSGIGHQEFTELEDEEKRAKLSQLIPQADFSKLYAFAQQEAAGDLNRESLEGQWVKYGQGSDHHPLEDSLKDKGTGWCTASGSAYAHLQGGDFYVYYTKGRKGGYTEPRIAIRMENGQVAEVRGVRPNTTQELEPQLVDIAQEQYRSLSGGEKYDKKASDMKRLTRIERKTQQEEKLAKEDLIFLYEMDAPIESFGYGKDPRIQELRDQRNPAEDMLTIFECAKDQIAHNSKGINQNTKAYVGPLEPGIFTALQEHDIENIYTSFPESRVRIEKDFEAGPITFEEFKKLADAYNQTVTDESQKIKYSDYAEYMAKHKEFATLKKKEKLDLVRLSVNDLFSDGRSHTTREIYKRAEELGLELCPAEVGPLKRLQDKDQPMNDWYNIAMKQISGPDGDPSVFDVGRNAPGAWLDYYWAEPDDEWGPEGEWLFARRK